jgi:hypothetical protein
MDENCVQRASPSEQASKQASRIVAKTAALLIAESSAMTSGVRSVLRDHDRSPSP